MSRRAMGGTCVTALILMFAGASAQDEPPVPPEPPRSEALSVLALVGRTLVLAGAGGAQVSVELGCEGIAPIAAESGAYVLCPPCTVVRVWPDEAGRLRIEWMAIAVDLATLSVVGGEPYATDQYGIVRRLDAWPREPERPPPPVPQTVELPDPRLDAFLEQARALGARGDGDGALRAMEAAARPVCPRLLWDTDIARAAYEGVAGLPIPGDQRGWLWAGIPTAALGVAAGAVGIVGVLLSWIIAEASASGDSTAVAVFGGVGLGSIALIIPGVVMIVAGTNRISGTAQQFERRQADMLRRIRPPRGAGPTEVFPAFGHGPCPP